MESKQIIPASVSPEAQDHFMTSYPWTSPLFADSSLLPIQSTHQHPWPGMTSRFMADTLRSTDSIRHLQSFFKYNSNITPANAHELDPLTGEVWTLYSLGRAIEGHEHISHGGFVATLLDQQTGSAVIFNPGFESPKTAKVTVEYLRPLRTPSAVLCRGWVERVDGRKIWAKAVVQGEDGEPIAKGEALYIHSYSRATL